jgi:hypothetical protein
MHARAGQSFCRVHEPAVAAATPRVAAAAPRLPQQEGARRPCARAPHAPCSGRMRGPGGACRSCRGRGSCRRTCLRPRTRLCKGGRAGRGGVNGAVPDDRLCAPLPAKHRMPLVPPSIQLDRELPMPPARGKGVRAIAVQGRGARSGGGCTRRCSRAHQEPARAPRTPWSRPTSSAAPSGCLEAGHGATRAWPAGNGRNCLKQACSSPPQPAARAICNPRTSPSPLGRVMTEIGRLPPSVGRAPAAREQQPPPAVRCHDFMRTPQPPDHAEDSNVWLAGCINHPRLPGGQLAPAECWPSARESLKAPPRARQLLGWCSKCWSRCRCSGGGWAHAPRTRRAAPLSGRLTGLDRRCFTAAP